ncbi:MAG: alpha/beta fold hydrolase [Bdellovibrionales bacterium]
MTRILALHGFLGLPSDWDPIQKIIKKHSPETLFQSINLFSEKSLLQAASPKDLAKKLNQQQKNQHVERNILVGYSLGGRLALQAAFDKPGLWDEIALVSTHPGLLTPEEKELRKKADQKWAIEFSSKPWDEVIKLWNEQEVFAGSIEPNRPEKEFERKALSRALLQWSLAHQDFVGESLATLKSKIHWYAGEKDKKFIELFSHLKADGFVEDFQSIEKSSHRVIFDNPEALAEKLIKDLKI